MHPCRDGPWGSGGLGGVTVVLRANGGFARNGAGYLLFRQWLLTRMVYAQVLLAQVRSGKFKVPDDGAKLESRLAALLEERASARAETLCSPSTPLSCTPGARSRTAAKSVARSMSTRRDSLRGH